MAKTATDLLNELASKDLVPGEVVASLRAQVAKAAKPVPPQQITRLLVEKGHLTAAQAQKLLGTAPAAASPKAATATATKPAPKAAPKPATAAAATQSIADDLTALDGLEPLESLDSLEPLADLDALDEPAPAAAAPAPVSAEPLDSLGDADLLGSVGGPDPLAAAAAASLQKPAPQKQPKPAAAPRSPMATALLSLNGVALLGVLAAAAFAFMPRANGDAEFQAAEGEYSAKSYATAAEQYAVLLEKYPQHPQAGLARVHQGLAKMHAAAGGSNWPQLLPVAKQVLSEIGQQPQLAEAQAELAPLVSNLAIGLAEQAAASKSPDQIAAAREALALADNGRYVPGNLRPWQKLAAAKESLAVAEYQIAKDGKLQKSIAAIKQAVTAKKLSEAHAAREELLAAYPELDRGPALSELGKELAAAALAAIEKAELPGQPETAEGPAPTVPLAAGTGPIFLAVASGQLWALDAAKGSLRWRRPIGGSSGVPMRTGAEPDADIVVIDETQSEVVRLAASSSVLRWRRAIPGLVALAPQIAGAQVVVAAGDGHVISLDAASGKTQAAVQLPVAIRAAPLVHGGHAIVFADQLYCFTLSASDLSPQSAAYLGHAPASAMVTPVALPQHKVAIENRGVSTAVLHVLDAAGSSVVQELALPGNVNTPPAVIGSRLIVAVGSALTVFDITSDAKAPLKKAAEQSNSAAYVVERAGKLVVGGGAGIQQFDLGLSGRTLEVKPMWAAFPSGIATHAPTGNADAVFCVRQEAGAAIAAAVRAANGQPLWETRLSLPEAAP